jgi:isochorismate hydrolase
MKERYFKPHTRAKTGQAMLDELFPTGQQRAKDLIVDRAALLALDLQRYFLDPESHAFVPSGPSIVPLINSLAMKFAENQRPVIFSQHINNQGNAGSLPGWWRELITEDHPRRSFPPELRLEAGEILEKSQYDAFYQTDLEARLNALSVGQVVIGGVMTHLCCETTARSAFVRGFEVFFLVDGTATYQRAYHMATLRNLGHGFATLVSGQQVLQLLEANR